MPKRWVVPTAISAPIAPGSFSFSYADPIIASLTPNFGPTAGGDSVQITGDNFGMSGSITFGGQVCPIQAGTYSHTSATCISPPGSGEVLVRFDLAGRVSNEVSYTYLDAQSPDATLLDLEFDERFAYQAYAGVPDYMACVDLLVGGPPRTS